MDKKGISCAEPLHKKKGMSQGGTSAKMKYNKVGECASIVSLLKKIQNVSVC